MTGSFCGATAGAFYQTDKPTYDEGRRRVLVTGAAGRIGSYFAQNSYEKYDLRLMVQKPGDESHIQQFGEVVVGDLMDFAAMRRFCDGIDTVVHLAGNPDPSATWKELLEPNVMGVYNIMTASKSAGCRRLIFASSIHAVSGGRADVQIKTSEPVIPGDLYGVTKAFGEALGRYMAEQEGLSVIALRIGGFQPVSWAEQESSVGMMDAFVSDRDLHQLIERCIEVTNLKFGIFHGLSNNRFNRLDISDAREMLGYDPVDDVVKLNPRLAELGLRDKIYEHNVGHGQKSGLRNELNGELPTG